MPALTKVAVAGATGNLGPTLTKELVDAGLEVTILSRTGKKPDTVTSDVKVATVDYASKDSLVAALKGHDAVVSILPDHNAQNPLIDAAIAAGVKRFIPSEFGGNVSGNDKTASLPVFQGKKNTQEYLKAQGDAISWTLVVTGPFLDWGLETGFVLKTTPGPVMMYPQGGPTKIFDGGERKFNTTLLSDIGKAVANVLKKPEETMNRTVYVRSIVTSQKDLLATLEKVKPGISLEFENVDVETMGKEAYGLLQKGEIMPAMISFLWVSTFGKGYDETMGGNNDNELLGIKELSREELEEVVKRYA